MAQQKEISVKELEEEIIKFLNAMATKPGVKRKGPGCNLQHGSACALGTCIDGIPRVTPIDFFNEGLTIWLAGEPGGKIANIRRNPNVSIGIYERVDHSKEQKSAQVWGTAELINQKNNPDEFKKRIAAFGLEEALKGIIEGFVVKDQIPQSRQEEMYAKFSSLFNFIKVTPQKIALLHMKPGTATLKKIWEPGKATLKIAGM